jgi:large subunit ribosomal protein L11
MQVVDHLDPKEYEKFLQERAAIVEQQRKDIQAKREAKLLRTVV